MRNLKLFFYGSGIFINFTQSETDVQILRRNINTKFACVILVFPKIKYFILNKLYFIFIGSDARCK